MLQNTLTYFQMEKNKEFDLKKKTDYIEMGKRAYKSAEEYFYIVQNCFFMILNGNHSALCTNMSFACELYIKSLLFYEKIECRNKHDLFELYNMLPNQIKNEIKKYHPCSNINKDMFEQELKELGKSFVVFRYSYERKSLAWNMQFLIELIQTLNFYTNKIFNK